MHILTHRGLDPSIPNFFVESSLEAIENQMDRGFGVELDLQITKDNKFIISHDDNLKRLTNGADFRKIKNYNESDLCSIEIDGCHLLSFEYLLDIIEKRGNKKGLYAIHIKHFLQKKKYIDILLEYIKDKKLDNIIFFDIKLEIGKYIKKNNKKINLAASVSHPYDIERYNSLVGGTLIDIETCLNNSDIFSWVWLDEWDRLDKHSQTKTLYNKQNFQKIRDHDLKIAVVSPELHAHSPGLLGNEHHKDAENNIKLKNRMKEIINLMPDAICTDYPELLKDLL